MPKFAKIKNDEIHNVELWESQPDDADGFTYLPFTDAAGLPRYVAPVVSDFTYDGKPFNRDTATINATLLARQAVADGDALNSVEIPTADGGNWYPSTNAKAKGFVKKLRGVE